MAPDRHRARSAGQRGAQPAVPPGRPALPRDLTDAVLERAERTQQVLAQLGCDVVGDASELAPDPRRLEGHDTADEGEVAEVATRAIADLVGRLATARDELRTERADRQETEQRLVADHARDLAVALETQENAFWQQHPWAHRTQLFKERAVTAEQSSRIVSMGLGGYRSVRARLGQQPHPDR